MLRMHLRDWQGWGPHKTQLQWLSLLVVLCCFSFLQSISQYIKMSFLWLTPTALNPSFPGHFEENYLKHLQFPETCSISQVIATVSTAAMCHSTLPKFNKTHWSSSFWRKLIFLNSEREGTILLPGGQEASRKHLKARLQMNDSDRKIRNNYCQIITYSHTRTAGVKIFSLRSFKLDFFFFDLFPFLLLDSRITNP